MTNEKLLEDYVSGCAESAFATLVRRHLNLVYSTALRQVRSPQLAEEVAQSVFIDLARHGGRIKRGTPLVAWLHVVARRTAVDTIRRESRRRAHENEAAQLLGPNHHMERPPCPWTEIEPILDEAMESLGPIDRAAVLLRFFENQSFREVGQALGSSDDAAQKRVTRALEQLRRFFGNRGVAITAAGLSVNLPANAIQAAPPALSTSIISVARVSSTFAVGEAVHIITMTTTQKILAAAVVAVAISGGIYEGRVISQQNAELNSFRVRTQTEARELRQLRDQLAVATGRVGALSDELAAEKAKTAAFVTLDPVAETALDEWLQKVVRLKHRLGELPAFQIPELKLLEPKDWLDATKEGPLNDDWDFREALNTLRRSAKQRLFAQLGPALAQYLKANNGQPPSDPSQLAPYLESAVDAAIWQRYELIPASMFGEDAPHFRGADGKSPQWMMTEKAAVDDYFDSKFSLMEGATGMSGMSKYDREIVDARTAFRTAHNNQDPSDAAQLAPYLHSAIDPSFIARKLKKMR